MIDEKANECVKYIVSFCKEKGDFCEECQFFKQAEGVFCKINSPTSWALENKKKWTKVDYQMAKAMKANEVLYFEKNSFGNVYWRNNLGETSSLPRGFFDALKVGEMITPQRIIEEYEG